jgi:hypothetical protein
MPERKLGYSLLVIGIILMVAAIYYVYLLFTNKVAAFEVYRPEVTNTKQQPVNIQNLLTDPQALAQMQSNMIQQIVEKQLNKTINLGSSIFLMYLIMLLGYRLSSLGVQLVRPINVKLRTKEEEK